MKNYYHILLLILISVASIYAQSEEGEDNAKRIDLSIGTSDILGSVNQTFLIKLEINKPLRIKNLYPYLQLRYQRQYGFDFSMKDDSTSIFPIICNSEILLPIRTFTDISLGLSYYSNDGFSSNSYVMNFGFAYRLNHFGWEDEAFKGCLTASFGYRRFLFGHLFVEGNINVFGGISYGRDRFPLADYVTEIDGSLSFRLGYQF